MLYALELRPLLWLAMCLAPTLLGCGGDGTRLDASMSDASVPDASPSADAGTSDAGGRDAAPPGADCPSATAIDLARFVRDAQAAIEAAYGVSSAEQENGRLLFQEGFSSTDLEYLFDHTALVYFASLPAESTPVSGASVGYRATFQGEAGLVLVQLAETGEVLFSLPNALVGTFGEDVTFAQARAFQQRLAVDRPEATIEILGAGSDDFLGLFTVEAEPGRLAALASHLRAQAEVLGLEADHEAYRVPFDVFPPVELTGRGDFVDLASLAERSREARRGDLYFTGGAQFTTIPSLPAPYGPGEMAWSGGAQRARYAVEVSGDEAACAETLRTCYGLERVPADGFTVEDGADRAASAALQPCVERVRPVCSAFEPLTGDCL